MKACVIQPAFSMDYALSDARFAETLAMLEQCDESLDLIVLPEYADLPCHTQTRQQLEECYGKFTKPLLEKAAETAKRCDAAVFVGCLTETETGLRNTTVAFGRDGKKAGCYYKQHLVPSEMNAYALDTDYTWEFSEPTILELDGVRYGFLTCYDFYFYEAYANLARHNPDVIIGCSHQRSDTHNALEMITKFCGYHCNAYVVRSSVSMGGDSLLGGCSMITAPDGTVLIDMKNEVGLGTAEFDPHKRYLKPAGFGNPPAPHHAYIEAGRRPWKYRPGGSAIVRHDAIMAYPRICAHRGFNSVAPENSLPAYGAAVALGAEEIEFDLWPSKDGVVVSIHDPVLDRVSTGSGNVWEHTYEELLQYDFGIKKSAAFEGLKIPTFEQILQKLACHTVMNVHIKTRSDDELLDETYLREIVRLIRKYDCEKYCYFMSTVPVLKQMRDIAPDIARCAGANRIVGYDLVAMALEVGGSKIQLYKPHFAHYGPNYVAETVERAHRHGIAVNVFWSDDPEEAAMFLRQGVDTVLTNDFQRVARVAEGLPKYRLANKA
ncbi:MAG: hypothetical protein IJP11_02485 [Oscillospiraceae bacterium]|nr:hypothetical protein [Oscillospiraceae bacterium]